MAPGLDTFPLDDEPLDVIGAAIAATRNRDRPVPASTTPRLVVHDGDEDVTDGIAGRQVAMRVAVVLPVASTDPFEQLGSLISASYAQAMTAILVDPSLGGSVEDIDEGEFRCRVATVGSPAAAGELDLVVRYEASGDPGQREAICAVLMAVLDANVATTQARREKAISAFLTRLESELGEEIERNRRRRQRRGYIILQDGPQKLVDASMGERLYAVEVRVRIVVGGADHTELGPTLNARVGALRAAALAGDRTLDGVLFDILEGHEDGDNAIEAGIVTTPGSAPTAYADVIFRLLFTTADDDLTLEAAA